MPVEIILPKVDMDMTHGTFATWHVAEGDLVKQGDALFDIETDKAAMEVEAPASGRLHNMSAKPGDVVAVGTIIALLYAEGEALVPASGERPDISALSPKPLEVAATGPEPLEVILPKVDMDMTHGTLSVWHVAEGAAVKQGAPLFDIETDKAAMEVEAQASGYLHHIVAQPGDKVEVGSIIAWIYPEGAVVGARPNLNNGSSGNVSAVAQVVVLIPNTAEPEIIASDLSSINLGAADLSTHAQSFTNAPASDAEHFGFRATPAARALSRKAGIAIAEISGTGPHGRIQADDVSEFIRARQTSHPVNAAPAFWKSEPGPLHITTRKGRGIPLVLIHGFTSDSQSWAPLEKALGNDTTFIRIDLPGHGKSPKRNIDGFSQLARMMVEAFDIATRDYEQVHIIAHSLGGAVALAIADIRGRKIASLNLLAPAGLGPEINGAALKGIVSASQAESLGPWLRQLTAQPEAISDAYARAAMKLRTDAMLRACQADMAAALFPDGVQAFDLRPALNRLDLPIQIIWGKQDQILPKQHAFVGNIDIGVFLMDKAGHIPHFECPERIAKIVTRLLFSAHPVLRGGHARGD